MLIRRTLDLPVPINDAFSAGQNQLQFQSRDDDGSYDATLMVIEHDGNVGIGETASPSSKLSAVGGNSTQTLKPTVSIKDGIGWLFKFSFERWCANDLHVFDDAAVSQRY